MPRCRIRTAAAAPPLLLLLAAVCFVASGMLPQPRRPRSAGEELADLLSHEAAGVPAAVPPYAMFHAFNATSLKRVNDEAMVRDMRRHDGVAGQPWTVGSPGHLDHRTDSLLASPRTFRDFVSNGTEAELCFTFHRRHYFRPDQGTSDTATPSPLQLWPYFYQHRDLLRTLDAHVITRVQAGVLDLDSDAFSFLGTFGAAAEVEALVLAYNDWDAYADEALQAVAEYATRHTAALYEPDGRPLLSNKTAARCAGAEEGRGDAFVRVRMSPAKSAAAKEPVLSLASAGYATMRVPANAGNTEAKAPLRVVGAARMAALGTSDSPLAGAFVGLHRSSGPRLYWLSSHVMRAPAGSWRNPDLAPASAPALHGVTAADVRRFVHQHSRRTFRLGTADAYQAALATHDRVLLLVGHAAALPTAWWSALADAPHVGNTVLQQLRRRIPFFLAPSSVPLPETPAPSAARCVLPARRLDLKVEAAELVLGADRTRREVSRLSWSSGALQARVVQRARGRGECQWVQPIHLPHPTAESDPSFYDALVGAALTELVAEMQTGEEEWVARLTDSDGVARQLTSFLRPPVSRATGTAPPALLMVAETAPECGAALQRLRHVHGPARGDARATPLAASAYAVLAATAATAEAELAHAARPLPPAALPHLFGAESSDRRAAWEQLSQRCPLYAVLADGEDIIRLNASAPAAVRSPVSLDVVDDASMAEALLELARAAEAAVTGTAANAEVSPTLESGTRETGAGKHPWRLRLNAGMEAPVLVYDLPSVPLADAPQGPTFVLLVDTGCGVCSNFGKAFELLRLCYTRSGGPAGAAPAEQHRFVRIDVGRGLADSRAAALNASAVDAAASDAHWRRSEQLLLPAYLTDIAHLKVPQLLMVNATHVVATLPTETYAERWHWPHAVMRLLALADTAADLEATTTRMWSELQQSRTRRGKFRRPAASTARP